MNARLYRAAPHRVRLRAVSVAAVLLAGMAFAAPGARAEGRSYPALFGSDERMFAGAAAFPKWSEMLERLARHEAIRVKPCRWEQGINVCEVGKWTAFVDTQRGRPLRDMLDAVNAYMNAYPYVLDLATWGVEDYWETPQEHVSYGGDCEDYAIAKFMTLRKLGVPAADLRVVVLNDLNLNVQHAVLAVYTADGAYILDNQAAQVQRAERIVHYQPIYSVTEGSWWLHVPGPQTQVARR
ncbi:MAG: transglutaminase-like cysteine peptidase [Gemmatimonas sp.]